MLLLALLLKVFSLLLELWILALYLRRSLDYGGRQRHRRHDCSARHARPGRRTRDPLIINDRGVVDNGRIMDVGEDKIVRRWDHVGWRPHPERHGDEHRVWKRVQLDRWERRHEHDEFWIRWWQQVNRRRRWRGQSEIRIVEDQHRPIDVDHLLRGRWINLEGELRKGRWRFESSRQNNQPSARVGCMRAGRISPQIGPIGGGGISEPGSPPRDRLAPGGDNGVHPSGHRSIGIGGKKFLVALQGVAIQRGGIGFLHIKVADRPRAYGRRLLG